MESDIDKIGKTQDLLACVYYRCPVLLIVASVIVCL